MRTTEHRRFIVLKNLAYFKPAFNPHPLAGDITSAIVYPEINGRKETRRLEGVVEIVISGGLL